MYEDSDPGDVTKHISDYYANVEASSLRRDRDALVTDNARKLAEICALKERLAALEAPTPKAEFPRRALRHRHQRVGLISQWAR